MMNTDEATKIVIFILLQLNLSGIDRDKVSGQAAAVIRPPRLHGPDSR